MDKLADKSPIVCSTVTGSICFRQSKQLLTGFLFSLFCLGLLLGFDALSLYFAAHCLLVVQCLFLLLSVSELQFTALNQLRNILGLGNKEAEAIILDVTSKVYQKRLSEAFQGGDLEMADSKAAFLQNLCEELHFDPQKASEIHEGIRSRVGKRKRLRLFVFPIRILFFLFSTLKYYLKCLICLFCFKKSTGKSFNNVYLTVSWMKVMLLHC